MAMTLTPTPPPNCDREWIEREFSKGIEAEAQSVKRSQGLSESPPVPELASLYHEIAQADERHQHAVELVAIRYGRSPDKNGGGGLKGAIDKVKATFAFDAQATACHQVAEDLKEKANAIHWYKAWAHAFSALGDPQSAQELEAVLAEETGHRDRLQEALNRLVHQATIDAKHDGVLATAPVAS